MSSIETTVGMGLQTHASGTGVPRNSSSPGVGLEFNVNGTQMADIPVVVTSNISVPPVQDSNVLAGEGGNIVVTQQPLTHATESGPSVAMKPVKPIVQYKAFEMVNRDVCDKLAVMSFNDFLKFWDDKDIESADIAKTQYNIITRYCQEQQKANYNLERQYYYADNATKGRIFVEDIGLQRIYNQFRGCLCDGLYYDLDMINAHPTILLFLCQQNKINSPYLAMYVADRDKWLQKFMSDDNINREDAKRMFLTAINKSTSTFKCNGIQIKNEFFINFDKELRGIQEKLIELHQADVTHIIKHNYKAKYNLGGCLTNVLMTKIENEILQHTITFLKSMSIIPDVPMFDGLMVRCITVTIPIPELIVKLNSFTYTKGIKWSHKPHNIDLKTRILSLTTNPNSMPSLFCKDTISVAEYLWSNCLKSRVVSCAGCLSSKCLLLL